MRTEARLRQVMTNARAVTKASLAVPRYCVGAAYLVGGLIRFGVAVRRERQA